MDKQRLWPRVVILTALPVEYRAVRSYLRDLKEEVYKGTVYERGIFLGDGCQWEVGIVQVGAGNAPTAAESERAIAYFQPRVVLFVGVAGGLKDVRIGDVVAVTKAYGYESGKAGLTFRTRPEVGRSTHRMEQRARIEAIKNGWLQRLEPRPSDLLPRVFIAPIAAGEKVVSSTRSATWKFLTSRYGDAVAIEMEGHGFYSAIHVNEGIDALIVRGISDLIDNKSQADAANSQEIAAQHASAFAFEVLAHLCTDERSFVSRARTSSMERPSHNVSMQNIGPIQAPIQIGNQNSVNNFITSPNEMEEGTTLLERGKIALSYGDNTTAKQHLRKAVQLLSQDQASEKNAQARYLLALAYLHGERPFGVAIEMWDRIEELLRAAIHLNPCYSYLYTFALFELDFSRNGWKKAEYKQEAQQLIQEAHSLPRQTIDEENIGLLLKSQFKLMQEMHHLEE